MTHFYTVDFTTIFLYFNHFLPSAKKSNLVKERIKNCGNQPECQFSF